MMGKLKRLWHRIADDLAVYLATLAGVIGSILWPVLLAMTVKGILPTFAWTDLVRLLGASIIAIVLAVRADQDGTPEQRNTRAAIRRRATAAFARGFAWQSGIAALTAVAAGAGG
jgi:hypothetical protein